MNMFMASKTGVQVVRMHNKNFFKHSLREGNISNHLEGNHIPLLQAVLSGNDLVQSWLFNYWNLIPSVLCLSLGSSGGI